MDPIRNPYAPGAGQRPPELAGRDRELRQFEVTLERVAPGRPERRMVLSGLRGVGKTVLLNALRGLAVQAGLGDRQDRGPARPVAAAARSPRPCTPPSASSATATATPTGSTRSPACSSRSRCAPSSRPTARADRWQPPIDVPAAKGRADSGDLELDLVELFTDVAALAARPRRRASRCSSTRCRTSPPDELAALCGACHEISQQGAPLVVVGAGLPHLPVALAASKSYAERLFRYVVVDRLPREMADRALLVPGRRARTSTTSRRRSTSSTG